MTTDDMTLLREYALRNSEEAFATLVSRHVNLVYSVALLEVRDPHLAGEITQAVFIILARKADSLGSKIILSGWLCRTARYASANALTIQRRRQQREQEAYMQSILNESEPDAWAQIAPLLGGAMKQLGQKDHDALVLRFFENKSFQEIGTAFGASENAAKKRVAYALEKLRKYFSKNGVTSTTATLAGAISANSVQAAPVTLVKTITAVAMTKGVAASGSTLTLIKGALKVMAWTKAKTAIVVGVAVILTVGTTTLAVKHEHPANGIIPQNSPAYAKYASPEVTFQSWRLAMSKGDLKGFLASLTPEGQNSYMETAGQGKSKSELVAMNIKIAAMISDFQIVSNQVVASDEAILHFHSKRLGNASVPMKQIQGEWKISGNLTAGSNDRGH